MRIPALVTVTLMWAPLFGMPGKTMAVEEAKYTVVATHGEVEIRRYPPTLVAETLVDGSFDSVGNEGFKRLAGYIFGNNRTGPEVAMTAPVSQSSESEKIAMTAPVNQERIGERWRIAFVMPEGYTLETLPRPMDERVTLSVRPPQFMAALKYGGTWGEDRYRARLEQLQSWMRDNGWTAAGAPVFARYNPPFMPWFLRRNEVLIPVLGAVPDDVDKPV